MASTRCRPFPAVSLPLRRRASAAGRALCAAALALFGIAQVAAAADPAPYPDSTAVPGISFRWNTHRQLAPGSDNWPLTWSADGHQYTSFGDGGGFGGTGTLGRVSLGFARVEGPASGYRGANVWGGFQAETAAKFNGKSYGIIAIGTDLYMWRCGAASNETAFDFQQIYKSTDDARTWRPASWQFPGSLTFYCPTFLQFGQGYAGARDDYVYMYASERNNLVWEPHTPGQVMLMRAPKDGLLDRSAYEFFAGRGAGGAPRWSASVAERAPVLTDANGARLPSVIYNQGLGRYFLLASRAPRRSGNISIFDAPEPWGPWTTVLYEDGWGRGNFEPSTFFLNFSPKWWGDDGRSFVLSFTGGLDLDSWNTVEGSFTAPGGATGETCGEECAPPRRRAGRRAPPSPPLTADDTAPLATSSAPVATDDTAALAKSGSGARDDTPESSTAASEPDDGDAGEAVETVANDDAELPAEDGNVASTTRGAARAAASLGAGSSSSGRGTTNAGAGRSKANSSASDSPTTGGAAGVSSGGTGGAVTATTAPAGMSMQAPRAAAAMAVPGQPTASLRSRRSYEPETREDDDDGEVASEAAPADAPAARTPASAPPTSTEPRLAGTMGRGAEGWAALVVPPNAAAPVTVRAGDTVGDWSVEAVSGQAVTLRSGDRTLVLGLFGAAASMGTAPGVAAGG